MEQNDIELLKKSLSDWVREPGQKNHKAMGALAYLINAQRTPTEDAWIHIIEAIAKPAQAKATALAFARPIFDSKGRRDGRGGMVVIKHNMVAFSPEIIGYACSLPWQLDDDEKRKISEIVGHIYKPHNVSSQDAHAIEDNNMDSPHKIPSKNTILYGPPGTGKTYSTILYAVSIIENKPFRMIKEEDYDAVFARYLKYKDDGLIAFTTFHQSFGYEEFIEGIRPVVSSEENAETGLEIEYEIRDGIFKAFCDKAGAPIVDGASVDLGIGKNPTVWKISLEGTGDNPTRTECMKNNHIRIGWDSYGEIISDSTDYGSNGGRTVLNAFYNRMQLGDIVMSCYSSKTIDAIGIITGEPEWHDEYPRYKRLRNVRWLAKDINEDIIDLNAGKSMTLSSVYKLSVSVSDALQILRNVEPELFTQEIKISNRVFIIDEINRGNISKIFGELITLIESSKRISAKEELRVILPYSGKNFGVPDNVYIIATMNTADRSLALMDTALRRRFSFEHIEPDAEALPTKIISGINLVELLKAINKRITFLYDKEHCIGHSYFWNVATLGELAEAFEKKIIPLLEEYFFEEPEKIQLVLGNAPFFKEENLDFVLREFAEEHQITSQWVLNKDALLEEDTYKKVYEISATTESSES